MFEKNRIYCVDCIDLLKTIPDESIDLIVTDPPYYRVMVKDWKNDAYEWDNQWYSFDEYKKWMADIISECERVLKKNGSLYMFADNLIGAHIQILLESKFHVIDRIEWVKTNALGQLGWRQNRSFSNLNESIFFCEKMTSSGLPASGLEAIHSTSECFQPIKDYMRSERDKLMESKGFTKITQFNDYIDELTETKSIASRHYFADSQYAFPTCEMYAKMQKSGFWQRPYEELREEYEELREEYEELREEYEELRRPFNQTQNWTNIWTSCITVTEEGSTIHPTQKPVSIIRRMIECSSRPGATVLDPFMGSGTTAVACIESGRSYIGSESDREMHLKCIERVKKVSDVKKTVRTIYDF